MKLEKRTRPTTNCQNKIKSHFKNRTHPSVVSKMSESVIKKSVVNSSNKSKKSKTDILRAALLNYLKQRNYVVSLSND